MSHAAINKGSVLLSIISCSVQIGGGKHNKASVIEQIPMGGYIIRIFAQILGSLR